MMDYHLGTHSSDLGFTLGSPPFIYNYIMFLLLVYVYLLGGVTFLPLALAAFVYLHPRKPPDLEPDHLKAGEIEENAQTGLDAFKQGWIIVTHEYLESPDHILSATPSVSESSEGKSAYASLYKLVKNSNSKITKNTAAEPLDTPESPMAGGTGATPRPINKKHRYYAVLKHSNLFLYKDEKMKDVKHVVVLSNHVVAIWPRNLTESLLFTKYLSIAILKKDWSRARRLSDNTTGESEWSEQKITIEDVMDPKSNLPAPPGTFFVYTDVNIDKEDWYFALIRATKASRGLAAIDPVKYAKTLHFDTENMVGLIQTLYSTEGQLHTKWINALMGRLFLSLQQTDVMRNYLASRIERKLTKMKTPGFLDKFLITQIRAGHGAPFITFPVLREISPDGDLLVSLYMQYSGGVSIKLATKLNLNLGSRFKTREMDVLLSMTLEKIQGPMLLKIKPPPSARMWYTFENEPLMSVKIEPIISSRQMSYTIITNSIKKKLQEAIKESVVLPHWDDFIFYTTTDEVYRGGVWDKESRKGTDQASQDQAESAETNPNVEINTQTQNGDRAAEYADTDSLAQELVNLVLTGDDDLSETVSLTDVAPVSLRVKLTNTLGDLSKRLRKAKSNHTLSVDETNCLSNGSMMETSSRQSTNDDTASTTSSEARTSTLRKIGNWYYDKSTPEPASPYNPPEMITNRRRRKQLSATLSGESEKVLGTSYDFGAATAEPALLARSIDSNADLLRPETLPVELLGAGQLESAMELDLQQIRRSDTVLHRKPPPGPMPDEPVDTESLRPEAISPQILRESGSDE